MHRDFDLNGSASRCLRTELRRHADIYLHDHDARTGGAPIVRGVHDTLLVFNNYNLYVNIIMALLLLK